MTVVALREHLERHAEPGPEGLVFCNHGGGPLRRATLYSAWLRARAKVGADNVTLHDLRHASATLAAQAGATTRELMARLGHSSPQAALRYQHASPERDRDLAARLGHSSPQAALRYQHASPERDRDLAARLDRVFSAPRDGRAMEPAAIEAEVDDMGLDLGL